MLNRPPAPEDHPIDEALRETLVRSFSEVLIGNHTIWDRYKVGFGCRDMRDVAQRIRARYEQETGDEFARTYLRLLSQRSGIPENPMLQALRRVSGRDRPEEIEEAVDEYGPLCALLALPDTEFLIALRGAVALAKRSSYVRASSKHSELINELFSELGVPFRHDDDGAGGSFRRVEQSLLGDAAAPAAAALADSRLASASQNFSEARRKLQNIEDHDLDDVVRDAARAVSETLAALAIATLAPKPKRWEAGHLFGKLQAAGVLPGSAESLVLAPARLRNPEEHQRGEVRLVSRSLAEASVAAASAAIIFLAPHVPIDATPPGDEQVPF